MPTEQWQGYWNNTLRWIFCASDADLLRVRAWVEGVLGQSAGTSAVIRPFGTLTPDSPGISQPPEVTAESRLAILILPGGELDQLLQRSRGTIASSARTDLCRQIAADRDSLRRAYENPPRFGPGYYAEPGNAPSFVTALRATIANHASADPVLGYCLATKAGLEDLANTLVDGAWQKYLDLSTEYQHVLAELIPADFVNSANQELAREAYRNGTNATAADDWNVFKSVLDRQVQEGYVIQGFPTGLPTLDRAMNGLNGLIFLGGEPGIGKTTLAQGRVVAGARADPELVAVVYSLDITKTLFYERLLCQESGVDYRALHCPDKDDKDKQAIREAEHRLKKDILPRLKIIERPQHEDWFQELQASCDKLLKTTGKSNILVVIDLFQRMDVSAPTGADGDPSDKHLTDLQKDDVRLDAIKRFRKWSEHDGQPHGAPVIVVSEIRKGEDGRHELTLADVKGSGRIAFDADAVLLMLRSNDAAAEKSSTVPVTLRIDKGRDGVVRCDIPLMFRHTVYQFTEVEPPPKKQKPSRPTPTENTVDPLAKVKGG